MAHPAFQVLRGRPGRRRSGRFRGGCPLERGLDDHQRPHPRIPEAPWRSGILRRMLKKKALRLRNLPGVQQATEALSKDPAYRRETLFLREVHRRTADAPGVSARVLEPKGASPTQGGCRPPRGKSSVVWPRRQQSGAFCPWTMLVSIDTTSKSVPTAFCGGLGKISFRLCECHRQI